MNDLLAILRGWKVWKPSCLNHGAGSSKAAPTVSLMIHPFAKFSAVNAEGAAPGRGPRAGGSRQQQFLAYVEQHLESPATTSATAPSSSGKLTQVVALAAGENPSDASPPDPNGGVDPPGRSRSGAVPGGGETDPADTALPPGRSRSGTAGRGESDPTDGPDEPGTRFVPADSLHPPRFKDVPDWAKAPNGPYHQAPAEFGGEWWRVTPFTGPQPWLTQGVLPADPTGGEGAPDPLPEGFVELFGPRPERGATQDYFNFLIARGEWEQRLEHFQGVGIPDGFDAAEVESAAAEFERWGLGQPVFYEGRYGWMARFPDSTLPTFEMAAATAVQASHVAIASYQIRLLREGLTPNLQHPFVPPELFPDQG